MYMWYNAECTLYVLHVGELQVIICAYVYVHAVIIEISAHTLLYF